MTTKAILKTCELLLATHYLPIACFNKSGKLEKLFCSYTGYKTVFSAMLQKTGNNKITLLSGRAGLYGAIHIARPGLTLITGPFISTKSQRKRYSTPLYTITTFPGMKRNS